MSTNNSTLLQDPGQDLITHMRNEPHDVNSTEWKQWELERLRLKCDKDRRTIRGLRISNDRNLEELKTKLQDAINSQERLKEMEIAEYKLKHDHSLKEKDLKCERLIQSLEVSRKVAAFYQLEQTESKANEGMKVRIVELEDQVKWIDKEIQELRMQIRIQEKENQDLKGKVESQINEINELKAMNESLKNEKSESLFKYQKPSEQTNSTAKPTCRPRINSKKKQNLAQRSLNTMFYEQKLSTFTSAQTPANASTHTSPLTKSTIVASLKDTTPTIAATAQQTMYGHETSINAIPQKRSLSTTLSDKTNHIAESVKSKKGKGLDVIKHEQVVAHGVPKAEDIPLLKATPTTMIMKDACSSKTIRKASLNVTNQTLNRNYPKPQEKASTATHNPRHRGNRSNMEGDTCISCNSFYGNEVLAANIHGNQLQVTGQDRIQLNSRHRYHRTERARTPPGFWDLDFDTPEKP
ncbi:hypothetical protein BD408DRAFT_437768 [Parasitella parasitica]|nr:hypothetical protein BD408DRAFT_437768 [Parasitella parasitica]